MKTEIFRELSIILGKNMMSVQESESLREQKLEIGASEDDINFPDTLTVTVEKTQTVEKDDKEAETEDGQVYIVNFL